MPGRTVTRTYHFNWIFIVKQVLGDYFKLDEMVDKDRQITKYAYFDSKTTTLTALGKAMNNYKLGCKTPIKKPWVIANSGLSLKKDGGFLLSRIALQYHRRRWA